MAYFRRHSRATFSGRSRWLGGPNTLKQTFKWTKPNSVAVSVTRSKMGDSKVLSKSHLPQRRALASCGGGHVVWRASQSQSDHGTQSSRVKVVQESQTDKLGLPTVQTKQKQKATIRKPRRTSVEFISKYALKRPSGSVATTMSVSEKSVAQVDRKRSKSNLTSRFKLVKKPAISDLNEKAEVSSKVVMPTASPKERLKSQERMKSPNLFKKVGSYQLVRVITSVSPKQSSKSQFVTRKSPLNAQSRAVYTGKLLTKPEHKSRFKLNRLRRTSLSRTVTADSSNSESGCISSSQCKQRRRSSCEKRVTRYKLVRGKKGSATKRSCRQDVKFRSHTKLLRMGLSMSRGRRVSTDWSQRKKANNTRSFSRQFVRRDDGTFMLKSRYCLVKNGRSTRRTLCNNSNRIDRQLSHEERVAQHRVTLQVTAHKLVRRSLSLVRARAAEKKVSKSNSKKFCTFFNRFGRCKKGSSCPCIHDPDKVAVCTKFLRGICDKMDGSCQFSHTIIKDKMPTCSFFLKGVCHNDNCSYSHVRVADSASVCEDFCRGYCPEGQKCKKKHILVCRRFASTGECPNPGKCTLHHQCKSSNATIRRKRSRSIDWQPSIANHTLAKRQLGAVKTPTAFKFRQRKGRLLDTGQRQTTPVSKETTCCLPHSEDHIGRVPTASLSLPIKPNFLED